MARRSRLAQGLSSQALAELVAGELEGDPELLIRAVAEPAEAGPSDAIFVAERNRLALLSESRAGLVVLARALEWPAETGPPAALVRVDDAHRAVAAILEALYPLQPAPPGVHPDASVHPEATLGDGVHVGARAVVGAGVIVGARSELGAGCVLEAGVELGDDCVLFPNVTLYAGTRVGNRVILHAGVVLGADGFGYARDQRRQIKVPQVGGVRIEDDVEIGANACVDRGTLRMTRIGAGTKIDNLVQVGHNCDVGRDCALSGLTGLSGSTVIEDGVIVGGNVGTAGHQTIGAGSMLAAKSGVHGDLPPGSIVGGVPHMEIGLWRRVVGSLSKLPELIRRVRRLERALAARDSEEA